MWAAACDAARIAVDRDYAPPSPDDRPGGVWAGQVGEGEASTPHSRSERLRSVAPAISWALAVLGLFPSGSNTRSPAFGTGLGYKKYQNRFETFLVTMADFFNHVDGTNYFAIT